MSMIEKITNQLIDNLTVEISKKNNKDKIHIEIIRPLLITLSNAIVEEFYPFIIFATIIFMLTFIFALIILIQILRI